MRQYDRIPTHIRAVLYLGRSFQFTVIRDISQAGARLDGAVGVLPGDVVEIALITGHTKTATVRWWLNGSCGVSFKVLLEESDPFIQRAIRMARRAETA